MISKTIEILFGDTDAFLFWDAPEGRPTSVTSSQVFAAHEADDSTEEAALTGSATVETNPNTTFDAASGDGQANPKVCNVAATTGVAVNRTYLATTAAGAREWVEVIEFDSGNSVTARHALRNSYTTGDTFESTRITHSIDTTWVADDDEIGDDLDPNPHYRWRLEYEVAGVTYVHDVYFDLVRYPGKTQVRGVDIDRLVPGFIDALPTDYREDQGQAMIEEAYDLVAADLHSIGVPDEMIRNNERVDLAVKLKTIERWKKTQILLGGGNELAAEMAMNDYDSYFNRVFKVTTSVPVAFDTGGGSTAIQAKRIWER